MLRVIDLDKKAFAVPVNLLAVAGLFATFVVALVVWIGHFLTSDWIVIWSAVTAAVAALSLAAFITTALYTRAQIDELKKDSVQALSFEQVRLTVSILRDYFPVGVKLSDIPRSGETLISAKQRLDDARIQMGRGALELDVINTLGEAAELYCTNVLAEDMFIGRADVYIALAWFYFGETMRDLGANGQLRLDRIERMTKAARHSLVQHRSALVANATEVMRVLETL